MKNLTLLFKYNETYPYLNFKKKIYFWKLSVCFAVEVNTYIIQSRCHLTLFKVLQPFCLNQGTLV